MTFHDFGPWLVVLGLVILFMCIPPKYDPAFKLKLWLHKSRPRRRQPPIQWGRDARPRSNKPKSVDRRTEEGSQ